MEICKSIGEVSKEYAKTTQAPSPAGLPCVVFRLTVVGFPKVFMYFYAIEPPHYLKAPTHETGLTVGETVKEL